MFFYPLNIPIKNNKNQYLSYSQYKSLKKKSLDYFTIDSIKIKNIFDKKSLNSSYEKSFEEKNNEFINDKTLFEIQQKNCGHTQQLKFQHNIYQKKRINFQKSQSQIRIIQNQTNQFKNQRIQNIKKNEKCIQQLLINSEIPQITARSWSIFNLNIGKPIYLKDGHKKREIASLTKIMTCYLSLHLIEKFQLNVYQLQFEVSQRAQNQIGTSSDLKQGYRVKIIDLLYALMLPSGNDAAYVLAENFGFILKLDKKNQTDQIQYIRINNYLQKNKNQCEIYDGSLYFINYMNTIANNLKLKNTYFDNMHGLMNKQNYSTAYDLSLLILKSMKNPIFLQIVSTKSYTCNTVDFKGNQKKIQFYIKIYRWQNTNKLLDNGFLGIKTGITDSAGPCLASYYKNENINIIVVVLKCQSSDHRFIQLIIDGMKVNNLSNLDIKFQQVKTYQNFEKIYKFLLQYNQYEFKIHFINILDFLKIQLKINFIFQFKQIIIFQEIINKMQFIISFGYVLIFYSLLAIISIILLDFMWIKRTQFFIIDQKISNGFQGLYLCIKLIFSKEIIKFRQYYGNDIFLYIYSLKVMMYLCFIIYVCQISINIFENLLIDKQIYFWDFFIINKSNKQCVNNEFCFLQRFINLILISIFILFAIKDIYETIQNCCLDFLQDQRKGLQIRTFLIHTYKEEGLQVINEINYFLANQNLGNIQFYQLLDNQQYKYKIQQKEQYYSYMKDYCLDKQINNEFKNCLIPSSYYQEQFYKDKFYKLKTKLQCEDFDQFSGAILICLERPTSIQHLIDNFKSEYNICDQFQFRRQDYKQLQVQNNIYSIQQITDSVEIVWQNVTSRFKWENYKKLLINLAAIFIILFLTTPSTLIHFLQVNQITKNLQEFVAQNSLQKQVLNNLQTLLILLFNQLLLILIQKMVFLEGHICYSNFQISNFNKTTRYLMLNMLIMPFIAVKATDSLYFLLINQSITYKSIVQQQFTYDQSLKFFTLIIQSGFLTFFSSIIRIDELIFNYLSPKIANDLRNIQKNIFNGFQYGYFSGIIITTMAIVLFLTKNVPMICLAGCLYLFFRLLVDTYNLTAVFKQEMESNGKFTQRFCQILAYTYFCILIYETGVLYYNQCIYLASILLLVSVMFYIIIDQKLNSSIYFKCIDDLYIDNLNICKDDRKKWLNLFKNPNYNQL